MFDYRKVLFSVVQENMIKIELVIKSVDLDLCSNWRRFRYSDSFQLLVFPGIEGNNFPGHITRSYALEKRTFS